MTGLNRAQYSLKWEKVFRAPYWLKTGMKTSYWSGECLIKMKVVDLQSWILRLAIMNDPTC